MDPTFWAALAGAGIAGVFTVIGVLVTGRQDSRERAADRQHQLNSERERRADIRRDARRDLALPALQRFSAQGEEIVRQLENSFLRDGRLHQPSGVSLDQLKADLEDALVGLELIASADALRAGQGLVRMIRPWDTAYWERDRADEWRALGRYRDACREDLFGDLQ